MDDANIYKYGPISILSHIGNFAPPESQYAVVVRKWATRDIAHLQTGSCDSHGVRKRKITHMELSTAFDCVSQRHYGLRYIRKAYK